MLEHVREDVERERKRLKRADGERAGWFTELAEVERKRDNFVEMRAEGDLSKEKYREKVAGLDARRDTAEQELERLDSEGSAEHLTALDALPSLVEEYLRDLPYLVHGGQTPIRDYVTVGAERTADNPLGVYTLTPEAVREPTSEEMEELRVRAERERGERFRAIYETLGLRIVAHADGTLDISSTFGVRTASIGTWKPVTGEEVPLPSPDEGSCRHGERGPETNAVATVVEALALSRPEAGFFLKVDGRGLLALPAAADLRERVAQAHGLSLARSLVPLDEVVGGPVWGLVSPLSVSFPTRRYLHVAVNGRVVDTDSFAPAVAKAYAGLLPKGRHPAAFLRLDLGPGEVDVNVHPAKSAVRLRGGRSAYPLVVGAIRRALAPEREEGGAAPGL